MNFEEFVLDHYASNGNTQIALIPQFAVPPGESRSIDLVGIDLLNRKVLYIEVCAHQTPTSRLIAKIQERGTWIPVARSVLEAGGSVIDSAWSDLVIVFVIDSRVEWMRKKIGGMEGVVVAPLSHCLPQWISGVSPRRGEPR